MWIAIATVITLSIVIENRKKINNSAETLRLILSRLGKTPFNAGSRKTSFLLTYQRWHRNAATNQCETRTANKLPSWMLKPKPYWGGGMRQVFRWMWSSAYVYVCMNVGDSMVQRYHGQTLQHSESNRAELPTTTSKVSCFSCRPTVWSTENSTWRHTQLTVRHCRVEVKLSIASFQVASIFLRYQLYMKIYVWMAATSRTLHATVVW